MAKQSRRCPECNFGATTMERDEHGWTRMCNRCTYMASGKTKAECNAAFYNEPVEAFKQKYITKSGRYNAKDAVDTQLLKARNDITDTHVLLHEYMMLGRRLVDNCKFCFTRGPKLPLWKSEVMFDLEAMAYCNDIVVITGQYWLYSEGDGLWHADDTHTISPAALLQLIQRNGGAKASCAHDTMDDDARLCEAIAHTCRVWKFCIGKPGDKHYKEA